MKAGSQVEIGWGLEGNRWGGGEAERGSWRVSSGRRWGWSVEGMTT